MVVVITVSNIIIIALITFILGMCLGIVLIRPPRG